ncbi:MAG: DUF948 domain-containing protein [Terriglobia bacterium]
MGEVSLLTVVISGAIVVLAVAISLVLYQVIRILADVRKELRPILHSVKTMADDVNTELERVDDIMKSAAELSKKVDATGSIAQEVITSPLIRIAALSAGLRRTIAVLGRRG